MATAIQRRRGNTTQHANFTGLAGEITIDTDLNTIIVHDGSTAGGIRLAKYSEVTSAAEGDISAVNTLSGSGLTGGATSGQANIAIDYENLTGNLVPSANNVYSLGSLTNVWKDVFVGPGSLYVNGQKVLEDNAGTIVVSADSGQNLALNTTGGGDIEFNSDTGGSIQLKSNVVLSAGVSISTAGGGATSQAGNINMNNNSINNLADPVEAQDAATKNYVDTDSTVVRVTGTQTIGGAKTFSDDAVFSGNLTVSGTTTTVNTETLSVADNIVDLNSNFTTGAPTENAGIRIKRGDSTDVVFRWNEANDQWEFTNDGAAYVKLAVDTDDLTEGSTNLYYTSARANSAMDAYLTSITANVDSVNGSTGAVVLDTGDIAEGANLYYTDARARAAVDADGDLSYDSGTGVFSFTERTDAEVRALFSASGDISYNVSTGVFSFTNDAGDIEGVTAGNGLVGGGTTGTVELNVGAGTGITVAADDISVDMSAFDTGDLTEGTNLYYTDARVRAAVSATGDLGYDSGTGVFSFTERTDAEVRGLVSATDAGGDGSFAYNSTSGVFTYTGPSASEVRAHFSAGTGVTISSGEISIGQAVGSGDSPSFTDLTVSGNLTVNGTQTIVNSTTVEVADDFFRVNSGGANVDAGFEANINGVLKTITYDVSEAHWTLGSEPLKSTGGFIGDVTGDVTGTVSSIANHDTGDLTEGTNLYYTTARANSDFDTRLATKDTADLTEGTNLYYTVARANTAIDARVNKAFVDALNVDADTLDGNDTAYFRNASNLNAGTLASARLPDLVVGDFAAAAIQTGAESFVDSDTVLMTAAAVEDRILSKGYTTNTGDITGVTAGSGLTGGGASGSVTLNIGEGSYMVVSADAIAVDATSANTAGKVVARDGSGNFSAGVITATATQARYADVAERYEADSVIEPGTVVCFGGEKEITVCAHDAHHAVAGVISTAPAYLMNESAGDDQTHPAVALTGRVPCKVVGPVAKGDLMVTSSVAGHAKADNSAAPGRILGKAIGSSEGGEAVIEVLVTLM